MSCTHLEIFSTEVYAPSGVSPITGLRSLFMTHGEYESPELFVLGEAADLTQWQGCRPFNGGKVFKEAGTPWDHVFHQNWGRHFGSCVSS
jgi:hypothetical protein